MSPHIETYLPDPYAFAFIAHTFPLLGLLISYSCGNRNAWLIWQRICLPTDLNSLMRFKAGIVLAGLILFFMLYYLSIVPFTRTGLYMVFADPDNSALAREYSLKLVTDVIVRYGYGFMASAFAPLLAVMLANSIVISTDSDLIVRNIFSVFAIVFLLFVVSLTGARSFAAMIIMTIICSYLLKKGLPLNPLSIVVAIVLILLFPAILSILREGRIVSIDEVFNYILGPISRRVFIDPVRGAISYAHYAQTTGFFGIAAIPKLAGLFDVVPVNAPNIIGLLYESQAISSISSNTSFVFSYYSYFGLIALPFSLILLWMLDLGIWVYRRLSANLLLPCVASINVACLSFIFSDYTTVLLTHGIILLLLSSLIIDKAVLIKKQVRI